MGSQAGISIFAGVPMPVEEYKRVFVEVEELGSFVPKCFSNGTDVLKWHLLLPKVYF